MDSAMLVGAGLSQRESELYLLLLQNGESLAAEIAKKTKTARPHVYDSLGKLQEKGLISYVIKNHRRYYKAADPKEILRYLEDQKESIAKRQEQVSSYLPMLEDIHLTTRKETSVEVYEGKEGLKTVLKDILKTGKSFVAFGASERFEKVLPDYAHVFIARRRELGIRGKLIVVTGTMPVKTELNEYRWIPKQFVSPASTVVYGHTVAVLLWLDTPVGIIIRNKDTAQSYRSYFEMLWKEAKTKQRATT